MRGGSAGTPDSAATRLNYTYLLIIQMKPMPSDDGESDINDDQFLSAINADLEQAKKQTDNKLLIALAAIVSILFLTERLSDKNSWLEGLAVVACIGAIGYTIYSVVRRSSAITAKYGLICPVCKHMPRAHMILSAATTHGCEKCGARLLIQHSHHSP